WAAALLSGCSGGDVSSSKKVAGPAPVIAKESGEAGASRTGREGETEKTAESRSTFEGKALGKSGGRGAAPSGGGMIGMGGGGGGRMGGGGKPAGKDEAKPAPRPAATVEAMAGRASRPPGSGARDSQSGLLTAGSFDDNLEPQYFRRFAGQLGQHPNLGGLPARLIGHRLTVFVKGSDGQPVGNAR